jgi:hypothetical protein
LHVDIINAGWEKSHMSQQVLEGSWEEIMRHADELEGKRVRLTVLEECAIPQPNREMLAALRKVKEIQQGMRMTSGDETQALLREARDGKMYGRGSNE